VQAIATIEFEATDPVDAEAIVAAWSVPGATSVGVIVYQEVNQTLTMAEASPNSPSTVLGGRADF